MHIFMQFPVVLHMQYGIYARSVHLLTKVIEKASRTKATKVVSLTGSTAGTM